MKTAMIVCFAIFAITIEMCLARPRFLAIPIEDVEFLEVEQGQARAPLVRMARAAVQRPQQFEERRDDQQFIASEEQGRFQRGIHGGGGGGGDSGHHDHVDFGAHTGHHGAFGWYADFPVHKER
ncbi:uncharacterized protein [Hetaerina americana]|uniref:uncharacterized protein n=1 Tax=Hetaerina americana TaxID=62018 RepID=UPI003A7F4ECF